MKELAGVWIFALAIILTVLPVLWVFQVVNGLLYENGTCTNENLMKTSNQTVNINGTVNDYLKSLPSDNTILAEIVCQDDLNVTTYR